MKGACPEPSVFKNADVDLRLKGPMLGETTTQDATLLKRMKEMRMPKTWMETEEVQAFAYLLDILFYTCSKIKRRGKPEGMSEGFSFSFDHYQSIIKP